MKVALEVDRQLVAIGERLDLLLNVSPANPEEAWANFSDGGYRDEPQFDYRPLGFDPDELKRRLYVLPVEDVEDPTLGELLREKRLELDRSITLLADRGTPRFLYGSLALFGDVEDTLLTDAEKLLSDVPPQEVRDLIEPEEFCDLARTEIDRYRERLPGLSLTVEVRDDVPGLMVAHDALLVSRRLKIARARAQALIQHEVGTHVVTTVNGKLQPFGLFAIGLPGYEETQEGLAVFAEYVSGGLDRARLRVLAARVVAVRRLLDGATFAQVFAELHAERGFRPQTAWSVTMRVFRSGGYTKDAIYLRGLGEVVNYVHAGGTLESLFVGKIGLPQVPFVEELLEKRILKSAQLRPRWMDLEGAAERVRRVQSGIALTDLADPDR
ncbi:MAG TPA: tyrosine/phenylalanine carboxypeptidase domain-containing protein [Actinomycetota bacterium]|nr:tyrosine/phenylalanine carboxypeptidase domain-containing protein [Actinomycetota bacterium]